MTIIVETSRLRLRTWSLQDLDAFWSIYREPEVWTHLGEEPFANRDRAGQSLERGIAYQQEHGVSIWAMELRETGEIIGCCGFTKSEESFEIAYHLRPCFWGRGYASEAVRAASDHAVQALGAQRVVGIVSSGNPASRRVLEKAGYALESTTHGSGLEEEVLVLRQPLRQN
jgi:ribosomal-protein-alanine N-acetyltransferase